MRGILYLHKECETQIFHYDIKLENILMDEKGCMKIANFGLAKLLMPNQTKTYTESEEQDQILHFSHINLSIFLTKRFE